MALEYIDNFVDYVTEVYKIWSLLLYVLLDELLVVVGYY